jgi:glutathione peroxidase
MKYLLSILFFLTAVSGNAQTKTIYDFKIPALEGGTIDFSSFKGKKILIVNTASMCGYTPQYEGLEALYKKYQDKLVVVGFPSDNFGGQEYANDKDIKDFCSKNYGVTFPLTTRVDVTGEKMTPVYRYLTSQSENGVLDATIKWNFNKFLIDETGHVVAYYPSKVKPDDPLIINWIEK